jgi:hypothetical protein
MGDMVEYGGLGVKFVSERLDHFLEEQKIDSETREAIKNSIEMMYEYIPYAIEQKEDPTNGKVLAKFLATKGMYMAKYFGNDAVNCGIAIVNFMQSIYKAGKYGRGLPLTTLFWGLAMLDLINVGNSCEPAQKAAYELFYKQSTAKLSPIRASVRQAPIASRR